MEDQPQSLKSLFAKAEEKQKELDASPNTISATFQENLASAITTFEESLRVADQVSLFSSNETLDDISSRDLPYLLIDYHLAELVLKITGGDRKGNLHRAQQSYERFLKLLDNYDILSKGDARLLERYTENPTAFSTASTSDAAARRDMKIARFKDEKELKRKLDYLKQNPSVLHNDENAARNLHLTNIDLCVHQTFQSLESIAQELQILAFAPPPQPQAYTNHDARQRTDQHSDGYSERLDSSLLAAGVNGPILSKDGKPLRPFTLLDTRQRLQQGVFRPDHSLPTMTIDEYLEEERKRGGIIEGGGPQSGIQPEPDEDDIDKADEETMKARAWDEFTEANPKGSGNTLNRG
ncbi:TAP42-like protein [Rhizodiscina lignyota]|uniref:TAP42-like protein n=1 Tax=Rhizodiscina lignyota TaxID=1504668 RepID=A0A9P4IQ38_9PEZI|nr:TAP42-like protein [Rhizodiscina lignyota]